MVGQANPDQRRRRLILVAVILLFMATNADGPSFNLTIPTLQREFGAGFYAIQMMANLSQLMVAAFVLAAGTLGDIYGRRRWLLIGAAGLLVGYLMQSFAASLTMILVARMLVGLSTALTTALTLAILVQTFPGKESAKAIGLFAGAGSLSAALMPIVAQWFNQTFGWRFSFVVPILLGGAGLVLGWRALVESRDPAPRKLDVVGVLLSAVGLSGIVYGFILVGSSGWQPTTMLSLALGAIALGLFIWWEKRTPDPALKLSLFKNPAFSIAVAVGLVLNLVDFGMHPIWSTFLQSIQGRTPLAASIILLPWALGAALIAPLAGRWSTRWSPRLLMTIGLVIAGVLVLGMRLLTVDASVWFDLGILLPFAMAYGLVNIPRTALLMASAPADESGAASAANSMGIETGTALGIAVFNSLVGVFAVRNYRTMLQDIGLSTQQVEEGVGVLRSAVEGIVASRYPAIPDELVAQLMGGFKLAYTSAIGQAFTIGAILLIACAVLVWFALRGRTGQALAGTGENG